MECIIFFLLLMEWKQTKYLKQPCLKIKCIFIKHFLEVSFYKRNSACKISLCLNITLNNYPFNLKEGGGEGNCPF